MKLSSAVLLRFARFAWAMPVTLPCFLFYILPCWALGWYVLAKKMDNALVFQHGKMPSWLEKLWVPWGGQCVGNCVVVRSSKDNVTIQHEMVHVEQVMTWGFLVPIAYVLSSLLAKMAGLDHYKHNVFEMAARMKAKK